MDQPRIKVLDHELERKNSLTVRTAKFCNLAGYIIGDAWGKADAFQYYNKEFSLISRKRDWKRFLLRRRFCIVFVDESSKKITVDIFRRRDVSKLEELFLLIASEFGTEVVFNVTDIPGTADYERAYSDPGSYG